MDKMLEKFHLDINLHEKAIQHALDKKANLNDVNVFMQPEAFDILTDIISKEEYIPGISEQTYRDKKTGESISYNQYLQYKKQNKKVRELNVLPFMDRVIFNMFYQILNDRFAYKVHSRCVSYKKGIGTSLIAKELQKELIKLGEYYVIKCDLNKFFDTVPIELIDKVINECKSEEPSKIWKPIINCYHDNRLKVNGEIIEHYQSLKQGNPLGAWLANIILYDIDESMSNMDVVYLRYSDDVLIVSNNKIKLYNAYAKFKEMLKEKGLSLNKDKTEKCSYLDWFEFLGFSFKGDKISVSKKTLKNIEHEIKTRTVSKTRKAHRPATKRELKKMIKDLQWYFFTAFAKSQENFGMGVYLFGTVNVMHDLEAIEKYCKDCLRAAYTNKSVIYGLGYVHRNGYVIDNHNIGQNCGENIRKTRTETDDLLKECGWISLIKMYDDYHKNMYLFENSVFRMMNGTF